MAVLCVEDLDHLVLTVADIKATCRFYQQVLGMTPFTFGNGRTALSFGNRKINLHEVGKGDLPQAHNPLPGTADLCFLSRTPAVEMLDHLKANGVPVEEGPVRREGALGPITSVYFRDPDGNLNRSGELYGSLSFREVCHARFAFHEVFSPCGNTTILVRESSLSPADRARVAAEIIAPGHLEAEQAGYVDTAAPVPRLDMMGGEFCVNATRAFAALLAEEGKLSPESGGLGGDRERIRDAGTPARPRPASGRPPFRVLRPLGFCRKRPRWRTWLRACILSGCRALRIWCWMPPRIRSPPTRIGTPPRCLPVSGCWVRMPPGASGFIVNRPACGLRLLYGYAGPGRPTPRRPAVPGHWLRPSSAGAFTATGGSCR